MTYSAPNSIVSETMLDANPVELASAFAASRPVDAADALNQLDEHVAAKVLEAMPVPAAVQILNEAHLERAPELVELLPLDTVPAILTGLDPDRRADVFCELPGRLQRGILARLDKPIREALQQVLNYPPQSAGGLMTTDFISVPADWTVEQTLQHLREAGRSRETVYTVCILDPQTRRLIKIAGLWRLVTGDPKAEIAAVAWPYDPITVSPLTDREEVARLLSKYNLLAVPVIAEDGHVLGIVTVDDVIDAIIAEGTEDVQKLGGVEALEEPYLKIDFFTLIRKRAGWLCVLFLSELLTASAMQYYEVELRKAVVLTLFIPLIMSSGGNSGSQATSLIIRALALQEVTLKDWWRIAARELPAGLVLGGILGVIGIVRIGMWQQFGLYDYGHFWPLVAVTVGLTLMAIVTFGSMTGSMLPFALKRLGFDPATASAPFVATLVDVTGLVIYFTVAYTVLRGTLL